MLPCKHEITFAWSELIARWVYDANPFQYFPCSADEMQMIIGVGCSRDRAKRCSWIVEDLVAMQAFSKSGEVLCLRPGPIGLGFKLIAQVREIAWR